MLILSNGYYTWDKKDTSPINSFFRCSEFTCPCEHDTCKEQKISEELVRRITRIRKAICQPIYITSGCRCAAHQEDLRKQGYETAVGISQHQLGNAADIMCPNIRDLYLLAQQEFKAIGKGIHFVHVDTRDDKVRLWFYK